MIPRVPVTIDKELNDRAERGALRCLREFGEGIDLSSNDYLGISAKLAAPEVLAAVCERVARGRVGATGSRLVSGTSSAHNLLESELAEFHGSESALVFGSGYEANMGLLSCVAKRSDTIIYDQHIHASMREGIRLSQSRSYSFAHNDLGDLREKIGRAGGTCYVAVESLYSMDGDRAPLLELCDVVAESGAYLIVDEAHATGVFGPKGGGLVAEYGVEDLVLARVHTFGKALGYRGGVVVCDRRLREYMINTAKPFIYSTAPDYISLELIREAYRLMVGADDERTALKSLVDLARTLREEYPEVRFLDSDSQIQGVFVADNHAALMLEERLLKCGIFARAIRAPTVPEGAERLRLCLHSFNTESDLRLALDIVSGRVLRAGVTANG